MTYETILGGLWAAWLVYWVAASVGVKPVERRAGWQAQIAYSAPLWVAAILLVHRWTWPLDAFFLPHNAVTEAIGILFTAAGLGFAVWARLTLGANWSSDVTVKQQHELVENGPYALARHPIYTGLSLAFIAMAIAIGEWRAALAAALAIGSFVYKLSIEERVMRETFGVVYDDYARRVKALVPFVA